MATAYRLEIVTPEKLFFEGDVIGVSMTTIDGEIGILAKHISCVAAITPSVFRFQTENGDWRAAAIAGGFAMIGPEGVKVLADAFEWPEDIELERAKEAKRRAEERISSGSEEINLARAQIALQRALSRLKAEIGRAHV